MWNADLIGHVLLKGLTDCVHVISGVQGFLLFISANQLDINTAVQGL